MSNRTAHSQNHVTSFDEVLTGQRILVVDDDDLLRGLHEAVLTLAGYSTQAAADGREALALLADGDFDLIVTDCRMPHLDGIGLIRALRSAGSRIPVVMLSGSLSDGCGLPADVRGELAAALPKPATTRELLSAISHALHPLTAAA